MHDDSLPQGSDASIPGLRLQRERITLGCCHTARSAGMQAAINTDRPPQHEDSDGAGQRQAATSSVEFERDWCEILLS
jgi:hypothetical protein